MDLVTALGAHRGVTCVVGAGGKKTTLYRLAGRLDRAVVTATVRIPIFDPNVSSVRVTDTPEEAVRSAATWPIGVVPEQDGNRYLGYDPAVIDRLRKAHPETSILVKADGARTRWFKAPNDDEPRLPSSSDTVLPIASARIVGQPLDDEHVHRPERVVALTGLERGDRIGPDDVAAVLASPQGGQKDVPSGAEVVPLINMVDDDGLESTARSIAAQVMDRSDVARVVLASMIEKDPLVAVVE